jgi:4-hydroxymandelate oxidase
VWYRFTNMPLSVNHRREFLRFLAASPLLGLGTAQSQTADVIASPGEALSVMDFEAAARKAIPPAHFGYMATGVDDDLTLKANREGYQRIQLRPRRMVDVSSASTAIELFGQRWETPIFICPCGSQKAFHPEGEMATAAAAHSRKTLQILSTVSTIPLEEIGRVLGHPAWYQLYATSSWAVTEKLVHHAESAGCPVLVFTVDLTVGRNTETQARYKKLDSRTCTACHPAGQRSYKRYPMFDGIDMNGVTIYSSSMTWDFVRRVKSLSKMKLVLKGIETSEDAKLCVENGVDGIVVSNHGGRAEESGRGTIECLPEVVDAVGGKIPVMIDGGVRRGTDVFKALALGATAVGVGRPYLWGLGAFGQLGVEKVLDLLRAELALVMRQCGARSIGEIGRKAVVMRDRAI